MRDDDGGFREVEPHAAATRSPTSRPTGSPGSRPSAPTSTPTARANAYPFAYEQTAQLFDSPAAPDLCVIHSASHNWEDQGGHLGEHGSIGIVQARAPMVIGGKGVKKLGVVPQAARLVDTAPTIAALLGCAPRADGRYVAVQDGEALTDVLDPSERPSHVVAFLFDGTNSNVLYDMCARGEAPERRAA